MYGDRVWRNKIIARARAHCVQVISESYFWNDAFTFKYFADFILAAWRLIDQYELLYYISLKKEQTTRRETEARAGIRGNS